MAHLIDKDALVAEIENLENTYKKCPTRNSYEEGLKDGRLIGYKDALHKIDTLGVKDPNQTMSKPEKFISDCTRNCSNELDSFQTKTGAWVDTYHEWLTPDQARRALEIAREEIYEWLQKHLPSYIAYCNNDGVLKGTELYINDLKQAMKDE